MGRVLAMTTYDNRPSLPSQGEIQEYQLRQALGARATDEMTFTELCDEVVRMRARLEHPSRR